MLKVNLLLLMMVTTACGNFVNEKNKAPDANQNFDSSKATVFFAEVGEKIFNPHCIRCHSNYGTYSSIKRDLPSIVAAIEQGRMPKDTLFLQEELKVLLRTWVAEGAFEKEDAIGEDPVTAPLEPIVLKPTWDSLSNNIFIPKCLVCHNPSGQAPWVDVSSREAMARTLIKHIDFKNPSESNLIIRLAEPEEPMPPFPPLSNISQLTPAEINVVLDWIKAGVP